MDRTPPSLCVIDDEPATRHCMADVAASLGICCEAFSSAEQFLDDFDLSLAGCVVSELHLKGMSGLELQAQLARRESVMSLVLVGANLDVPTAVRGMRNGAVWVFEKPCHAGLLTGVIRDAIDRSLATRDARRTKKTLATCFASLDPRERQVMAMIVGSLPNKVIAGELHVCQRTAARIRASIFEKMGAESAVELAQMAAQLGSATQGECPRTSAIHTLSRCHSGLPAPHTEYRIQERARR